MLREICYGALLRIAYSNAIYHVTCRDKRVIRDGRFAEYQYESLNRGRTEGSLCSKNFE